MALITLSDKVKFVESVFGAGNLSRDSRNFDVRCPACSPADRTKRKLSILLSEDVGHCWACGLKGNLWTLIRSFSSREKLVEYRDRFLPEDRKKRRDLLDPGTAVSRPSLPADFSLLVRSNMNHPDVKAIHRYLASRGVTERDMWYFRLGYSSEPRWARRVIVPSFDAEGKLNYFVARAIDQFRRPKYDAPDNDKLPIIFNEMNVDWSSEVILCEGAFDLMKCPDNAVPLLGSDINAESALFNTIVVNRTPIVLMLDDDMLVKKTPKVARLLTSYDVPVRIARLPRDSDPGKLDRSTVVRLAQEARSFGWEDTFSDRLSALHV